LRLPPSARAPPSPSSADGASPPGSSPRHRFLRCHQEDGMAGALGTVATLVKETVTRWTEDKASALAAALAYYALFSLAPLVLIAVAVAGLVFGHQAAEGGLYAQLAGLIGDAGAKAVETLVASMHQQQGGGIIATIVGVATLLFGASGVFAQLQDSMN